MKSKREVTLSQYIKSRDAYYQKKIPIEMAAVIGCGLVITVAIFIAGSAFVMAMVEWGWID